MNPFLLFHYWIVYWKRVNISHPNILRRVIFLVSPQTVSSFPSSTRQQYLLSAFVRLTLIMRWSWTWLQWPLALVMRYEIRMFETILVSRVILSSLAFFLLIFTLASSNTFAKSNLSIERVWDLVYSFWYFKTESYRIHFKIGLSRIIKSYSLRYYSRLWWLE